MIRLLRLLKIKLCARGQQNLRWKALIPIPRRAGRSTKFGFRIYQFPRPLCFSLARLRGFAVFGFFLLILASLEGTLLAMPPVQRMTLSNQMVLLTSEEHSLPFVTLQLLIDAGSRRDSTGEEGAAHLTAKGLLLGKGGLGENLQEKVEPFFQVLLQNPEVEGSVIPPR